MDMKKTAATFVFLAAWVMTTPGYSQNRGISVDGNSELPARDMQVEYADRSQIEENRWNAYLDGLDRRQIDESLRNGLDNGWEANSVAARFINRRPDLGCLYYDENDIRHWYPHCHEPLQR